MSIVHFASAHVKEMSSSKTLPAKLGRLLAKYDLASMFRDQRVAVKMHLGGGIGYTTIHPVFVRIVVDAVRLAGGDPFVTDGNVGGAKARGYTEEVLSVPVVPAAGISHCYLYSKRIGYRGLKTVQLCGEIVDAGALVVLSHAKGHGNSGFGGAIKNLGMGCVTSKSRRDIHRLTDAEFVWQGERCTHCRRCSENCPTEAIRFNEDGSLSIWSHHCRYCMHCVESCPRQAITIDREAVVYFQHGMGLVTKAVVKTFKPNRILFLNVITDVTPFCDCWGFSTPSLVPDVGIMASTDLVALEQASLDAIKYENYIKGSLPNQFKLGKGRHLFEKIHGKDPYLQVAKAEEIGLGTRKYQRIEIE